MPSIFDFLSGGLGGEDDYLARDPFYGAARSVGSWNLQPQTDSEAIWGGAVQGLLGGLLSGYGRQNARETAYQDYSSRLNSPLFQSSGLQEMLSGDYSTPTMPENWSPKVGQSDLMLAAIMGQSQQDAAAKRADLLAKYSPEVIAGEAAITEAKARAQLAAEGGGITSKDLKASAIKEQQTIAQKEQSLAFIDREFERAKDLTGISATFHANNPFIATTKGESLEALRQGLITQVDRALGREVNDKIKAQLLSFTPSPTDTEATVENKKEAFKNYLSSLFEATPVLESAGLVPDETVSPAPPPGYELTGKRDANGNFGIRKIK